MTEPTASQPPANDHGFALAALGMTACWVVVGRLSHACAPGDLRLALFGLALLVSVPTVVMLVALARLRSARSAILMGCAALALQQFLANGLLAEGVIAWVVAVAAWLAYLRVFGCDDILEGTIVAAVVGATSTGLVSLNADVQAMAAMRAAMPH